MCPCVRAAGLQEAQGRNCSLRGRTPTCGSSQRLGAFQSLASSYNTGEVGRVTVANAQELSWAVSHIPACAATLQDDLEF